MKTLTPEEAAAFLTACSSANSVDAAVSTLPEVTAAETGGFAPPSRGEVKVCLSGGGGECLYSYTDGGCRGALDFQLTVSGILSDAGAESRLRNLSYAYRDRAELCLPHTLPGGIRLDGIRMTKLPSLLSSSGRAVSFVTGFRMTFSAESGHLPDAAWFIRSDRGFARMQWFRALSAGDGAVTEENRYFDDPGAVSVLTGKALKVNFRFDRVCGDAAQDALLAVSDAEALGERATATLCLAIRQEGAAFRTISGVFSVSVTEMCFSDGVLVFSGKLTCRGALLHGTGVLSEDGRLLLQGATRDTAVLRGKERIS